ncbi:cytosolic sulfotransferase 7 [Arabidopsis lyrata subsp. lyrata]|uniref:cytosolic sulfotransferase 7 n=1 Tax=Arabidopsis lyrata subsp. lyrata TaxID=81972 RepID=UPI000A29A4E9|nr:cytosolic sulfotransferase 7 [Arabidopsis lyrata subsp. lyrata]|eukprot:XP_020866672.1 cytosolic sulfotransferase 7 [Arabidopsis lyrata subsp. lyrata]
MDETEIPKKLQNEDEETISLISSLPLDVDFDGTKLFKYQGYWYNDKTLQGVLHFQRGFEPKDMDIIIASFPKSGTTWLKALTVDLLERSKQKHSSDDHPLLLDNPHGLVPFLELRLFTETSKPDLTTISSSLRLFSTHMGFQTLREALKNSPCKIVYVGRNMKDVLVSFWYTNCAQLKIEVERSILDSIMFESFCRGVINYGSSWEHVLNYWRASLEDSKDVLFLKYEELKKEPRDQLNILAEFLGCPFTVEEEESGSVEEILDLCSLGNLKNLEINKTGKTLKGPEHKNFFREGEVGDSKNYLTPEMEKIIDMIIEEKFRGSDLKF